MNEANFKETASAMRQLVDTIDQWEGFTTEDLQALHDSPIVRQRALNAIRHWALDMVTEALECVGFEKEYKILIGLYDTRKVPETIESDRLTGLLNKRNVMPKHFTCRNFCTNIVLILIETLDKSGKYSVYVRVNSTSGEMFFDLYKQEGLYMMTTFWTIARVFHCRPAGLNNLNFHVV